MECKYEIENSYNTKLTEEDMKEIICKKIVRLIFLEESQKTK